jgi:hypothetical protein
MMADNIYGGIWGGIRLFPEWKYAMKNGSSER